MKLKSISGTVRYVRDLDATAAFYEAVGFRFGKRENGILTCYVNWFWLEFHESADAETNTTREAVAVSVDDPDALFDELKSKGITAECDPQEQPWGRREFTVADPDGYKIVFFAKK